MTEGELDSLLARHPRLWHMAEAGAWPSIRDHGLWSASALLDRFGVAGPAREAAESARRPARVVLEGPAGRAVIRDNGPLHEGRLAGVLDDGLTPRDWYRMLNGRVFFWLSEARLRRLLAARAYRSEAHDVIEVEAAPLIAAHRDAVALSPINSGSTIMRPVRRGLATFARIADYDYAGWRARRGAGDAVVELAVDRGVPDLARFVRRVARVRGDAEEAVLFERARP